MLKTKELKCSLYFETPIYSTEIPEWVDDLNKICDKYIKDSKNNNKTQIKEKEKKFNKKIGDLGMSHHSNNLIKESKLSIFNKYIINESFNILNHMGYDLTNYQLIINDIWAQEFAEKGSGHHSPHLHQNNHVSGFYYLKCSDKTSFPVFHDPRNCKLMSQLPLKNENDLKTGNDKVNYKPKPGTLIFIPSYLIHEYVIDYGIDPFRFIHFNIQAVKKDIIEKLIK